MQMVVDRLIEKFVPASKERGWEWASVEHLEFHRDIVFLTGVRERRVIGTIPGDDGRLMRASGPVTPPLEWSHAVKTEVVLDQLDRLDPTGILALRRPEGHFERIVADVVLKLVLSELPMAVAARETLRG